MSGSFHIEPIEVVDGELVAYLAVCEELPELIGRGADADEAVNDCVAQIFARVLH